MSCRVLGRTLPFFEAVSSFLVRFGAILELTIDLVSERPHRLRIAVFVILSVENIQRVYHVQDKLETALEDSVENASFIGGLHIRLLKVCSCCWTTCATLTDSIWSHAEYWSERQYGGPCSLLRECSPGLILFTRRYNLPNTPFLFLFLSAEWGFDTPPTCMWSIKHFRHGKITSGWWSTGIYSMHL